MRKVKVDVDMERGSEMRVGEVIEILQQMDPRLEIGIGPSDLVLPRGARLSPRETEVLKCLARGDHLGAIADELDVSLNTVRNHVHALLVKTGTHSTREVVVTAIRLGLLTVEEIGRPSEGDDGLARPSGSGHENGAQRSQDAGDVAGSPRRENRGVR